MNTIELQNEYGEAIQVKGGAGGSILVRHSALDITADGQFATFLDVGITVGGKPAIGAFLVGDGETQTLSPEEASLVRETSERLRTAAAP
jgi:hypothetical protein